MTHTERPVLALLLSTETMTYGDPTLRLQARVVRLENGEHVRNILDGERRDGVDGNALSDLCVTGLADAADTGSFAWHVEYRDVFAVQLPRARAMAATLTRVQRRTDKLTERYGHPTTFSAYVLRAADALGITRFVWRVADKPSGIAYDDSDFRIVDAGAAAYWLDDAERTFRAKRAPDAARATF